MIKANSNVDIDNLKFEAKELIHKIEKKLGEELIVTSGYRSKDHPIEASKTKPGEHSEGLAIDVACNTPQKFYDVLSAAVKCGVLRIGISRKKGFIHLGFNNNRPKSVWTY